MTAAGCVAVTDRSREEQSRAEPPEQVGVEQSLQQSRAGQGQDRCSYVGAGSEQVGVEQSKYVEGAESTRAEQTRAGRAEQVRRSRAGRSRAEPPAEQSRTGAA